MFLFHFCGLIFPFMRQKTWFFNLKIIFFFLFWTDHFDLNSQMSVRNPLLHSLCLTSGWRWSVRSGGSPCWWLEAPAEQTGTSLEPAPPRRIPAPPLPAASQTPWWAAPGSQHSLKDQNGCWWGFWSSGSRFMIHGGNWPTRTTVASAFSGIFSSSFSSCLDLDLCMPDTNDDSFCSKQQKRRSQGWRGGQLFTQSFRTKFTCRSFLSTSMRVSESPVELRFPMRGSVTDGSCWWMWLELWWCVSRLVRLTEEIFLGKWLVCSFSSLGWLREAGRGRESVSRRRSGSDHA